MVSLQSKMLSIWLLTIVLLFCTYFTIYVAWGEQYSPSMAKMVVKRSLVASDEMNCGCANRKTNAAAFSSSVQSVCDGYATWRGPNQKVVSYSFYGVVDGAYFPGIAKNAELLLRFYPSWVMRVYHNLDYKNESVRVQMCKIWCKYPHLDLCPMQNLPPQNKTRLNPKIWRFYPLGDPLVERFVVRDLDTMIIEREVTAVGYWMISGKSWHFMNDHEYHYLPIMGGMWGATNRNVTLNKELLGRMILESKRHFASGNDQTVMEKVVLPVVEASGDYINHHSYPCRDGMLKRKTPFPVRRINKTDYVGAPTLRYDFPITSSCPKKCRPPNHLDWELC